MRHIPEAGAVCGNPARTDLRGGRGVNLRSYRNTGWDGGYRSSCRIWLRKTVGRTGFCRK
jgi:hypothetical protein